MQDRIVAAEQRLAEVVVSIADDDYLGTVELVQQLHKELQQLFADPNATLSEYVEPLQQLATNFSGLVSTVSYKREQIKDSLSHIAAVKSANKISKTYKID